MWKIGCGVASTGEGGWSVVVMRERVKRRVERCEARRAVREVVYIGEMPLEFRSSGGVSSRVWQHAIYECLPRRMPLPGFEFIS